MYRSTTKMLHSLLDKKKMLHYLLERKNHLVTIVFIKNVAYARITSWIAISMVKGDALGNVLALFTRIGM